MGARAKTSRKTVSGVDECLALAPVELADPEAVGVRGVWGPKKEVSRTAPHDRQPHTWRALGRVPRTPALRLSLSEKRLPFTLESFWNIVSSRSFACQDKERSHD